ncbi:hypothetical protein BYT27DRAFT_7077943 [Phlegmacium glaucopus]|nr:hypothetical protein BYT27DRAFT_7077943 [Phlegmacium glaucopus]
MSSTHSLVAHTHNSDRYIPCIGEIIVVSLAMDLYGPGSDLSTLNGLPTGVNKHNYHHAVVLGILIEVNLLQFIVFPVPAYSTEDANSHLSSASWLLSQPDDFKSMHIPLPYETSAVAFSDLDVTHPSNPPHPSFPTPVAFGDPLEVGGWKDRKPSWVLAVPQQVQLSFTTQFKSFDPPIILSPHEISRLQTYSKQHLCPSTLISPPPPGNNNTASGGSPNNISSNSGSSLQQPDSSGCGSGSGPTGRSPAWQGYAVRQALLFISNWDKRHDSSIFDGSEDDEDDDEEWEDNMDPVTFARYYANTIPEFAKIVQDHDYKARMCLNSRIMDWARSIGSGSGSSEG